MKSVFILLTTLVFSSFATGHEHGDAHVRVEHPWARPTPTANVPGAVYFSVASKQDDRLLAVTANEDFVRAVELHDTLMQDGMMRMRKIDVGIKLSAGETLLFAPGGKHIMLMGLSAALKEGDKFPLYLEFEKAGRVAIEVQVKHRDAEAGGKKMDHSHHH